jgi:hypothetical protein
MPRKSSTKTAENTTQAIADALDTPLNLEWDATAELLGLTIPELQERMAAKLDATVFAWANIPAEHQGIVDAIARDLESEASVRRLDAPTEPTAQLSPVVEDIPELPEELQLQKVDEHAKKEPTALTQTKAEKLKESDQKAQQLASSDNEVKVKLHALKGQKSGAQLATIELAAEDLTYRKIKGEALVRKVGQLTSEMSAQSDFDPIQLLVELGIDSNSEIFEDLKKQIEPALGKLESAVAQITENAWVNGVKLEVELSQLENLLNSNELTADCWQ